MMEDTPVTPTKNDKVNIGVFPPAVGAALVLLGIILHVAYPFEVFTGGRFVMVAGALILLFGIGLQIASIRSLRRAKTTPLFKKPTKQILQQGPYGKSRNPIYVAVLTQFLGLALLVNTFWLIVLLPVLFVYLRFWVIDHEEKYLERKFGDEYRTYKASVPRWI